MWKYFTILFVQYISVNLEKKFYIIEKLNFNFFSVWPFLLSAEIVMRLIIP